MKLITFIFGCMIGWGIGTLLFSSGCNEAESYYGYVTTDDLDVNNVVPIGYRYEVGYYENAIEIADINVVPLIEIEGEYEIITEESNFLTIEVWDTGGWYIEGEDGVVIKTLRRVEITVPYTIEIRQSKHLRVLRK